MSRIALSCLACLLLVSLAADCFAGDRCRLFRRASNGCCPAPSTSSCQSESYSAACNPKATCQDILDACLKNCDPNDPNYNDCLLSCVRAYMPCREAEVNPQPIPIVGCPPAPPCCCPHAQVQVCVPYLPPCRQYATCDEILNQCLLDCANAPFPLACRTRCFAARLLCVDN